MTRDLLELDKKFKVTKLKFSEDCNPKSYSNVAYFLQVFS